MQTETTDVAKEMSARQRRVLLCSCIGIPCWRHAAEITSLPRPPNYAPAWHSCQTRTRHTAQTTARDAHILPGPAFRMRWRASGTCGCDEGLGACSGCARVATSGGTWLGHDRGLAAALVACLGRDEHGYEGSAALSARHTYSIERGSNPSVGSPENRRRRHQGAGEASHVSYPDVWQNPAGMTQRISI